jgi:iron(III) transport system permease protein
MSIIQVLITFITVSLYIWVTRKAYKFVVVTGKAARPSVHALRRFKYLAYLICLAILTLIFFLPFAAVVLMSLTTFITVSQGNLYLSFTVQNYTNALSLPLFYQSFLNSILLGIAAAGLVSLIAVLLSYGALKTKTRGARLMEYIGTIPLAVPGIVYGLALFWTFLLLPGINILYGTIWPLVITLVFVRLPQSVRMLSGNVVQISDEMEEASRVCGGSWATTMRRVVLPLLKGGLTSSFIYTFINSLRELGSVIILVTPQSMVLTVLLLNLYSQHPMALNTIAAAAVILCIVILVPLVVIEISQRAVAKRRSRSSVSSEKALE